MTKTKTKTKTKTRARPDQESPLGAPSGSAPLSMPPAGSSCQEAPPQSTVEAPPVVDPEALDGVVHALPAYIHTGMSKLHSRLTADLGALKYDRLTAAQMVQVYIAVRSMVDEALASVKPLTDALSLIADVRVPEAFEREGISSFTTSGDAERFRVTVAQRMFSSVIKENRDAAYEWLRANEMGDLIQETVNSGTLSAQAKLLLEQGRELPEHLFSSHFKATTSLTKVAARKS